MNDYQRRRLTVYRKPFSTHLISTQHVLTERTGGASESDYQHTIYSMQSIYIRPDERERERRESLYETPRYFPRQRIIRTSENTIFHHIYAIYTRYRISIEREYEAHQSSLRTPAEFYRPKQDFREASAYINTDTTRLVYNIKFYGATVETTTIQSRVQAM